jgi:hypothetical protein
MRLSKGIGLGLLHVLVSSLLFHVFGQQSLSNGGKEASRSFIHVDASGTSLSLDLENINQEDIQHLHEHLNVSLYASHIPPKSPFSEKTWNSHFERQEMRKLHSKQLLFSSLSKGKLGISEVNLPKSNDSNVGASRSDPFLTIVDSLLDQIHPMFNSHGNNTFGFVWFG